MSVVLEGLEDSFDNESAEKMLQLSVGSVTYTSDLVRKSLYDFDLETPEGIEKLMALIPIMDPEILKDIMTELWPGYPTDVDARRHRLEIKGYLKDYLESINDLENEGAQPEAGGEGDGDPDGIPQGQEGIGEAGQVPEPAQVDAGASVPNVSGTSPQPGAGEQTQVAPGPTA